VAARKVLRYPHPSLKRVSREVEAGPEARRVADDLLDTMRSYTRCTGIAAPQIDELVRLIAVDVSEHPKATVSHGLLLLLNPRVVSTEGAEVAREGCLSIPDYTANVRRARRIEVEAIEPSGEEMRLATEGFEARCVLHEIDHLDGVLFLDRVDSLKTDVFRRQSYG
jgi:peptide deformylase